eukprot:188053_1
MDSLVKYWPNNVDINRVAQTMILKNNIDKNHATNGYIATVQEKNDPYTGTISSIIYTVNNNRYCVNKNGQHKSNRIKFIVDFKIHKMFTSCFDPDCRDGIVAAMDLADYLFEKEDPDFEQKLIAL